jgi:5-carboxymethyl-2-hydroxymuconate isomerase
MPHVTVEYSANIKSDVSTKVLMKKIHESLADFSTFNLREIKSRCVKHPDFYMGDVLEINCPCPLHPAHGNHMFASKPEPRRRKKYQNQQAKRSAHRTSSSRLFLINVTFS